SLWRYTRLIVNLCASRVFKSIPLPGTPTYSNQDVTVVISTLANSDDFRRCLPTISACNPALIIIVTPKGRVNHVRQTCYELGLPFVLVLGTGKANKRLQMIKGLRAVRTSITFFADDDVFWAPTLLSHLLAPLEDHKVGAVGMGSFHLETRLLLTGAGGLQTLERKQHPNCWDFLGTIYLERRRFELAATNSVDGGVGCLSGRTLAIRTGIVQNEQFIGQFWEEKWLGFLPLVAADDDNFVTRYLVNHGWKIAIQLTKEAELTTTLEDNPKFLAQCIRWRRTTWRSNFTSLFIDRVIWR
ncbi:MAG: hypothetical protein Q9172_005878, partial [Xanthocarpia lactea]